MLQQQETPTASREEIPNWVKIVSGSVGSILTALVVTPLEVVKVRQQAQAPSLPSNVSLCPRGCGTFVFHNGLNECLLPKSAVPYFDAITGQVKQAPKALAGRRKRPLGTLGMVQRIFATEGMAGIYAGLSPTLVMGVPNTVLYFWTYDELTHLASSHHYHHHPLLPAVCGATARFVASCSTAPLELIRTRQAAAIGAGAARWSLWKEFRTLVHKEGYLSLYRGLSPTLARDVPFSAVYWFCIEGLRDQWKQRRRQAPTTWEQAGQALVNGSVAGMIAAACTTPLDVVKTLRQVGVQETTTASAVRESTAATAVSCDHQGAVAYQMGKQSGRGAHGHTGTIPTLSHIFETEGVAGLWKGNQARMAKVAPACAIMLSSYEIGKRVLGSDL